MPRQGSIAPKERVNIVYRSETEGASAEVELPLKLLMLGDYTGRSLTGPLEESKPISVRKENFDAVLAQQQVEASLAVPNHLVNVATANDANGEDGANQPLQSELNVSLRFRSMRDFTPDGIAEQVPQMRQLLELREALQALKGPLGNVPAFKRKMRELLSNDEQRTRLLAEINHSAGDDSAASTNENEVT